jgi:hypothetical protein
MKKKPTITYRIDNSFYARLKKLTDQVISKGFKTFDKEFANIDQFYKAAVADNSDRTDHTFRRASKELYLIEAIYYQILDEAYREAFDKAKYTAIILPACLALRGEKCERKEVEFGKVCNHCAPGCQINKITEIASKYGVEGYFSKRALTEQLTKIRDTKKSASVIGISCILTLASGMRTAREVGLPARGVFLNFTGCDHWAEIPFVTETMLERVEKILEEKYGARY